MALRVSLDDSQSDRPAGVGAPGFTGRDREVTLLAQAAACPPAVVLLEGEAGIGKTRLVQEVVATGPAGRRTALIATCQPYRESPTFGPVVDALRLARPKVSALPLTALAGALRPLFPEWVPDLPPALEPVADATVARHRLLRALAELVGLIDVELLVVEDAHWADDATLELLLLLTAGERAGDLTLVVTYRPEEVPAGSLLRRLASRPPTSCRLERIPLESLDVAGTAALVSSMLDGQPVSDAFAGFLHEATGGVPLAVEESVRLMVDRADVVRRDGEWVRRELGELQVPPTVRDSVLERLDRLGPAAVRAVRAVAVLVEATDDTVYEVAGLAGPAVTDGLAEAVARGLLGEDEQGRLAFRHALVRKAVYEAIPGPERRRLHLRAGEALERITPLPVVELTRHFREATDTPRWRRYAERAAEAAAASNDYGTAATLLTDLLAGAELPLSDRVRLTRTLAGVTPFHREERLEYDVVARLRELLRSGDLTVSEEGEIRSRLGALLMRLRKYDASRAELQQAFPLVRDNPVEAAPVLSRLGWPTGRLPASEYLRWLRQLNRIDPACLPPAERGVLLANRASALLLLGEEASWGAVEALPTGAATLEERLHLAVGSMSVGVYAMAWGRYAQSRQRLAVAMRLATADQFVWMRSCILVAQAHLDWFTGHWDGLAGRVATLINADDTDRDAYLEAVEIAALLRMASSSVGGALEQLRWVAEEARRRGLFDRPLGSAAWLGRLLLATGDVAEALWWTDEPVQTATTTGIWIPAAEAVQVRVRALLAAGRVDEANDLVSTFARGLRGRTAPAPRAALADCRAVLTRADGANDRAASMFGRAADAWQRLPRPYEALLAREEQGRCLLEAGRDEAGVDALTTVFHELARLGARTDAERVAERLRDQGVEVRREWRRGRRGYGDQLSPRELAVVRLVATGKTNREIAEAISRSPKTVAWQLNSAMRKLGVSTRTALAVAAIEAGITDR